VIEAANEYRLERTNSLDDFSMATPAIVGDRLVIRTQHHLYSIRQSQVAIERAGGRTLRYSARRTSAGSTRLARIAGTSVPSAAIATISTAATAQTRKSLVVHAIERGL
jgi:hypothetical protein